MLKNKFSFPAVVAAVLGLTSSPFSTRRAFDGFTSTINPRQWHDPERVKAAAARRVLREQRNLSQADAGGYGSDWQAL